jgi:hypothetical protein
MICFVYARVYRGGLRPARDDRRSSAPPPPAEADFVAAPKKGELSVAWNPVTQRAALAFGRIGGSEGGGVSPPPPTLVFQGSRRRIFAPAVPAHTNGKQVWDSSMQGENRGAAGHLLGRWSPVRLCRGGMGWTSATFNAPNQGK